MKTLPINFYNSPKYANKISKNFSSQNNNADTLDYSSSEQKVYASHLGFKGVVKPEGLINDYKWFINHDRLPAIESFLKIDSSAENMEKLICDILADENMGFEFIDSIVTQPRKIKKYFKDLKAKLPDTTDMFHYFLPQNPYRMAYEKYIETRYRNASSVSELLKIRPDWKEECLIEKHKELYRNDNFELGHVPDSIGAWNYEAIIQHLKMYMDYGFKMEKNIADYTINGQTFKFKNIVDGKSDKNVFLVETPSGQKFIIKIADASTKGLNKPFAIGTCSIIDTYLTQNNCRNSAPLRYYHHDTNSAIYDYIEHEKTGKIESLHGFVDVMPDFVDLGLRHNDTVGINNYFKLNEKQDAMRSTYDFDYGVAHEELISVDNDHVTYAQSLCPLHYDYHRELPVAMQMFF